MLESAKRPIEPAGVALALKLAQAIEQVIAMRGRFAQEQQQARPEEVPRLASVNRLWRIRKHWLYVPIIYPRRSWVMVIGW
ncbi:MAG: hypothetical protein NVS1B3_03140 [Candidatus Dormibacteraceae bacterium]